MRGEMASIQDHTSGPSLRETPSLQQQGIIGNCAAVETRRSLVFFAETLLHLLQKAEGSSGFMDQDLPRSFWNTTTYVLPVCRLRASLCDLRSCRQ